MPVTAPSFGGGMTFGGTPTAKPAPMPIPNFGGTPTLQPGQPGGGMYGGLFGPNTGVPGAPSTTPPMGTPGGWGGAATGMEGYTPKGITPASPVKQPGPGQGPAGGGGYDPAQANPWTGNPPGRDLAQEAADVAHRINARIGQTGGGGGRSSDPTLDALRAREQELEMKQKLQRTVQPWALAGGRPGPTGGSLDSLARLAPSTSSSMNARSVGATFDANRAAQTAGGDFAFDPTTNERYLTRQGELRISQGNAARAKADAEANFWANGGNLYGPGAEGGGGTRRTTGGGAGGDVSLESLWNRAANLVGPEAPVLAREDPLRQLAPVAPQEVADRTAVNARAFGKAKGQVGRMSQAALNDLRSQMTGRGISGSGIEGRLTSNVINAGYGRLGDVATQQAAADAEIAQRVADQNYQGQLTQRGQDIGQAATEFGGNINQRGQDASMQQSSRNSRLQSILSLVSQFGGRLY